MNPIFCGLIDDTETMWIIGFFYIAMVIANTFFNMALILHENYLILRGYYFALKIKLKLCKKKKQLKIKSSNSSHS